MAALTYPLALATFFDQLPVESMLMDLPEAVETARTRGGEQLSADVAERLWQGEVRLGVMTRRESGRPLTLLDLVRGAGRTFHVCDTRHPYPLEDPAGTILGAATVQIASLDSDPRLLSLKGLPAAYVLSAGDYLSFAYDSGARQALHRVVDATVTASGLGVTPLFEVLPAIRGGAAVDATVTLKKPFCKAQLVFGSVTAAEGLRTIDRGASFRFVQTLR